MNVATLNFGRASRVEPASSRAFLCARVAEENKAQNILVIDMRGVSPLFDFFVLATGNSRRHMHTLSEEIDAAMHALGDQRLGIEGYESSKWIVQDYGDVVVHVFEPETRRFYDLEELWSDAPHLDWQRG